MSFIKELLNADKNMEVTVLIREPGIYERYVGYYFGENKDRHKELESKTRDGDILLTCIVKDFLELYEGKQLLKRIQREKKILHFG